MGTGAVKSMHGKSKADEGIARNKHGLASLISLHSVLPPPTKSQVSPSRAAIEKMLPPHQRSSSDIAPEIVVRTKGTDSIFPLPQDECDNSSIVANSNE